LHIARIGPPPVPRVGGYPLSVIAYFDAALKQYLGIGFTAVLAVAIALGLLLVKGWRLVGVGMVPGAFALFAYFVLFNKWVESERHRNSVPGRPPPVSFTRRLRTSTVHQL
jgi:hypothetical protein